MRQEEGSKFCFDTRNNRTLPFNPGCPKRLNVWSLAGLAHSDPITFIGNWHQACLVMEPSFKINRIGGLGWQIMSFSQTHYMTQSSSDDPTLTKMYLFKHDFFIF
jgi:hypothetical protein